MRPQAEAFPLMTPTRRMEWLISVAAVAVGLLVYFYPSVLLVATGAVMIAVALFRFDRFMEAMIVLMPWYPFVGFAIPIRDVFLVLRLFLFAMVFYRIMVEGRSIREWLLGNRLKKGVLGFAILATVSVLASFLSLNVGSIRALIRLYSYLAVFYAADDWIKTPERLSRVLKLLFISLIVVDVFGFYQVMIGGYSSIYFGLYPLQQEALEGWEGRIVSFLFQYNSLAGYLNVVFPLAAGCAIASEDKSLRSLGRIAAILTVPAIFLTQSRGGVIALIVVILIGIWILNNEFAARLKMVSLAALISAIVVPVVLNSMERLQQLDQSTALTRLALWNAGLIMFLGHPVLGVGYGNYRALYDAYVPGAEPGKLDAHSIYFQYLAELGVIGFVYFFGMMAAFLAFYRRFLRNTNSLKRIACFGAFGAIVSMLVHGTVDYLFTVSPQFGGLFWLVLALGLVATKFEDPIDGLTEPQS